VDVHVLPDTGIGLVEELAFRMPTLPSYDHCKAEEREIMSRSGGYELTPDGTCVTKDFDGVLSASLELHSALGAGCAAASGGGAHFWRWIRDI
jgi:hypothetical protein